MAALLGLVATLGSLDGASPWLGAGDDVDRPIWGLRDGIAVALWPAAIEEGGGEGGPRGLLRIGYPLGEPRRHRLVNFIAVEPDVGDGHWRGLSELEHSDLDGVAGKRFTADPTAEVTACPDDPTAEMMRVRVRIERFANGAHPWLELTFRTDRPDEVQLAAFAEEDSVPMRQCVLTATMGNYARLRQARLADGELLRSSALWPDYADEGFTPFAEAPLGRLPRGADGDVIVEMESDEADPAGGWPYGRESWWRWPWEPLVQYWRKPAGSVREDLTFAANGRVVYWGGSLPIPGGIAFENTELRQAFAPGDPYCFGIGRRGEP